MKCPKQAPDNASKSITRLWSWLQLSLHAGNILQRTLTTTWTLFTWATPCMLLAHWWLLPCRLSNGALFSTLGDMQCANMRHGASAVDVARVTCTFVWLQLSSWGRTYVRTAHAVIKTLVQPCITGLCMPRSTPKGHAKNRMAMLGVAH